MQPVANFTSGEKRNGASAVVVLPQKFPNSMLLTAIRDKDVRQLLSEEEELRRQRNAIKDELHQVQDEKDKTIRELRPKTDKFNNDLTSALAELHAKKDTLYRKLDELRAHQEAVAHARDALRGQSFLLPNLNREVNDAEMILRDEQRELERVEKMSDANRIDAQRKRVEKFSATLQQKTVERKKVETERQASKEAMDRLASDETPEQRNKRFQEVRAKINEVQEEINTLKRKRVQRPENSAVDACRTKQAALHEELTRLEARLDTIRRDSLPHQHFTYPPAAKMEIVGRNGATLRQLQIDFGVAVCVDMIEPGHGFVAGGAEDIAACVAAIEGIVAGAATGEVETDKVDFDPAMKRQIIGTRGATIDSFERESGARLVVTDDCVEISGSPEAVDAAKAALSEFIDNLGSGEMPFDVSRMSQIIGKGGATISQIEKESGVRSLRVDRARGRLMATGCQEAIAKAFAMYKAILGEVAGGTATVQGNDQLVRAIIGPKGRTVRELEEATGARISCDSGNNILITGAPGAVKAAKDKIEELRRAETRVPVDARMFNFLTAALVRVGPVGEPASSSEPRISPLEAVQRATGCDQIVPVRSEGTVIIRGRPELAQRAATLVKQLVLRNPSHALKMPYAEVLRGFLLRRQTSERGSSLVDQVSKNYSPFLRIDVDRDSRMLIISSNDVAEAKEAAQEMGELLKDIMARQVRILEDFPEHKFGQLIGPGGSNIRELQESTGTEVAVVRELRQVQLFSPDGDAEALGRAVAEIHRNILHDGDIDDSAVADAAVQIAA